MTLHDWIVAGFGIEIGRSIFGLLTWLGGLALLAPLLIIWGICAIIAEEKEAVRSRDLKNHMSEIEQAREAKRAQDAIDARKVRMVGMIQAHRIPYEIIESGYTADEIAAYAASLPVDHPHKKFLVWCDTIKEKTPFEIYEMRQAGLLPDWKKEK